jgi:hypothetical protein
MTSLAILLGLLAQVPVASIGVVFAGELAMIPFALWAIARGGWRSSPKVMPAFLVAWAISVAGYVATDMIRGTPPEDFLRGWGRLGFLLTNALGLYQITKCNPKRLAFYLLGYGISGCVVVWLSGRGYDLWKFGYGIPCTVFCLLFGAALHRGIRNRITTVLLLSLAVVHVVLDFRSAAGICAVVACSILVLSFHGKRLPRNLLWIGTALAALTCVGIYVAQETQIEFSKRRTDAATYRLSGYYTSIAAIGESPWVGYGSWSNTHELQAQFSSLLRSGGANLNARFEAHSQILQSWCEGGILATFLFFFLAWQLVRATAGVLFRRPLDAWTGLFGFVLLDATWNVFLGPFAGNQRLTLAIALVILAELRAEVTRAAAARVHRAPPLRAPYRAVAIGRYAG